MHLLFEQFNLNQAQSLEIVAESIELLASIPDEIKNEDFFLKLVEKEASLFSYVPQEYCRDKILARDVINNPEKFGKISLDAKTKKFYEYLCINEPTFFCHVPQLYLDSCFCKAVVEKCADNLVHVPLELQTKIEATCIEAIKENSGLVNYIAEHEYFGSIDVLLAKVIHGYLSMEMLEAYIDEKEEVTSKNLYTAIQGLQSATQKKDFFCRLIKQKPVLYFEIKNQNYKYVEMNEHVLTESVHDFGYILRPHRDDYFFEQLTTNTSALPFEKLLAVYKGKSRQYRQVKGWNWKTIFEESINKSPSNIKHVPMQLRTKKMLEVAYLNKALSFNNIPKKKYTIDILLRALQQKQWVPNKKDLKLAEINLDVFRDRYESATETQDLPKIEFAELYQLTKKSTSDNNIDVSRSDLRR